MDIQNWPAHHQDMAPPPMPLTPQSVVVDTTRHFPSTHQPSPTSLSSSHGSDHSLESTRVVTAIANGSDIPPLPPPPHQPAGGRNLDPNLGDSPSWNSAMRSTPIPPLDHFYHFQRQVQVQAQSHAQLQPRRASLHSQSLMPPPPRVNSSSGSNHSRSHSHSHSHHFRQEERRIF
ncbi:hypothetical protein B0F90DRAFT_1755494, partial [Multifurca ochricompacta]